jgi:hypothetical protein
LTKNTYSNERTIKTAKFLEKIGKTKGWNN